MFHDMLVLRDELATQFHEKDISISIDTTKSALTVEFVNSPLYSASPEAKPQRADAVASFVVSRYKHLPSTVFTKFVSKRGSLSVSQTLEGHPATR